LSDTSPAFFSNWTTYWLLPLLADERFNDNRTLILLTFDENESYTAENRVFSVLLGGVVPANMKGQTDSTYYTHYSTISTVEANWQLKNLGRNDVNKTVSNVFALVANVTGYKNEDVPVGQRPMTNLTGVFPGPLNAGAYVPFTAPANQSAIGAGGQGVLILPGLNTSFTPSVAPAPVNLTSEGLQVPSSVNPNITFGASSSTTSGKPESAAIRLNVGSSAAVIATVFAVAILLM
jgi:hypothetical protein